MRIPLQPSSGSSRPHIWWCPVGPFSLLPMHAAGWYTDDATAVCASDYLVSSYLPTIRSMNAHSRMYDGNVLQIVQPSLPEMAQFPSAFSVQTSAVQTTAPRGALLYSGSLHCVLDRRSPLDSEHGMLEPRTIHTSLLHLDFSSHLYGQNYKKSGDGTAKLSSEVVTAYFTLYDSVASNPSPMNEFTYLGPIMLAAGYRSVISAMW
jgi:hypothetical protein